MPDSTIFTTKKKVFEKTDFLLTLFTISRFFVIIFTYIATINGHIIFGAKTVKYNDFTGLRVI